MSREKGKKQESILQNDWRLNVLVKQPLKSPTQQLRKKKAT